MKTKLKTKKCICGHEVGQKTRTCPKCQNKFLFEKKIINGKNCPNCTNKLRKRAKECIKCGHVFPVKKLKHWEEITEWRKLKKGQAFFIRKGGKGPIYITDFGEKILMGCRGRFTVHSIKEEGILALSEKQGGMFYIYMGERKPSKTVPNFINRAHKLMRKI